MSKFKSPIPVLPLRDIVVFPNMIVRLFVGREKSVLALEEVMKTEQQILLVAQKDAGDDNPGENNIFKVADSQVATRWGNITDFKNFDLITPNEKEARFSLADQDSSISNLTRQLALKTKFKNLILKLG